MGGVMADLDLDRFMRGLARRNAGEREFHQAVREVVGSLIPFLLTIRSTRPARSWNG